MRSGALTEWITINGNGTTPVVQGREAWLDLEDYADCVFFIDVSAVVNPGAGSVSLLLETAPEPIEQFFVPVERVAALTSTPTGPLVRKAFMNAVGGIPLARLLRWKLVGSVAGNWSVTFRVLVSVADGMRNPFSPLALPNLRLWLRADLGITFLPGTNRVTEWKDQSGLPDRTATAITTPIWTDDAIGGRPALDFAGSKAMENTLSNVVDAAGSAYSVLIVAKNGDGALFTLRRTAVGPSTLYSSTKFHTAPMSMTYVFGDGVNGSANITVASTGSETKSVTNAFKSCHAYKAAPNLPDIYVNTSLRGITGGSQQTTETGATGFHIGTNAANEFWSGLIAEIIVVDDTISTLDRLRVEQYQADFYGV